VADPPHPDRVPDAESATADDLKFTGYLLSETHPIGRGKAKFFRNLGYNNDNYTHLRDQLLSKLPTVSAAKSRDNPGGGENYEAVIQIEAPGGGTVDIRTFWEVHPQTGTRLITAYPLS
jgi:hypothetical protein